MDKDEGMVDKDEPDDDTASKEGEVDGNEEGDEVCCRPVRILLLFCSALVL